MNKVVFVILAIFFASAQIKAQNLPTVTKRDTVRIPITLLVGEKALSPELLELHIIDPSDHVALKSIIIIENNKYSFQVIEKPRTVKIQIGLAPRSLIYTTGEWYLDSLLKCNKMVINVKKMNFHRIPGFKLPRGKHYTICFAEFFYFKDGIEHYWRSELKSLPKKYYHKKIRKALKKSKVYTEIEGTFTLAY